MKVNNRKRFFPDVTDEEWNDWKWQVRNRIETVDQLKKYIDLTEEEEAGIREALKTLRMAITPYYLSLIDTEDPECPIRKQAIPTAKELHKADADLDDPLHEDSDSPVPGLTHRYPDRVLFLITDQCSMYCRHCTRRRFAGQRDAASPVERIDKCIEYIARTPQVRDVLLSGGDALLVSDERLEYIIRKLREIPHVEIIRIGSRTPVVLPQRITPELVAMLSKYHPIWLNTHFNHPNEITEESTAACARLANAGVPLGNQSVLLRGNNDCTLDETPCQRARQDTCAPLLHLSMRPLDRNRAFPHSRVEGHRDNGEPARTHIRICSPDIRGRRPRRRRQNSGNAQLCHLAIPLQGGAEKLRGRDNHLHGAYRLQGGMPLSRL